MRRRRWVVLAAGALTVILSPVMAGAAPLTSAQIYKPVGFFRFCAEAQLDIANMDAAAMATKGVTIGGTIYENYPVDFQYSKSSVSISTKRIMTATWTQYRDVAKTQPYLVRCKLRTGESLSKGAWPPGSSNNGGRFAVDPYFGFGSDGIGLSTSTVDQQCSVVNQRTIDNVWANLTPGQQSASTYDPTGPTPTLTTGPDTVEGDGPSWLADSPPLSVAGNTLKVSSRSLVANSLSTGNSRLEGAHYCTLVAPEYLRDVLLGTATVA